MIKSGAESRIKSGGKSGVKSRIKSGGKSGRKSGIKSGGKSESKSMNSVKIDINTTLATAASVNLLLDITKHHMARRLNIWYVQREVSDNIMRDLYDIHT